MKFIYGITIEISRCDEDIVVMKEMFLFPKMYKEIL